MSALIRSIHRLQFLLRQYPSWCLSEQPGESVFLDCREIHIRPAGVGYMLSIRMPTFRLSGQVSGLKLEKGGRAVLRLRTGRGPGDTWVVLAPRESEKIGMETTLRQVSFRRWVRTMIKLDLTGDGAAKSTLLSQGADGAASSLYRCRVQRPNAELAMLAADQRGSRRGIHHLLAEALLWYGKVLRRGTEGKPVSLLLVIPGRLLGDTSRLLAHSSLLPEQRILVGYRGRTLWASHRSPSVNFTEMREEEGWPKTGVPPYQPCRMIYRILETYPGMIRRFPRAEGGSAFRFRGLEVCRTRPDSEERVFFGPPDFGRCLDESSWSSFADLMREMLRVRQADSKEKRHPFYRWQSERWLEEMILTDIQRLDPNLDPRRVYSQVPARQGGGKGFVDLLTINQEGRLVVIELKLRRSVDVLFQGLDYWDRVNRLNRDNQFQARGFFEGCRVSKAAPLLYLVAPVMAFDRSLEDQARLLNPSVEAYRVGIGMQWRHRLTVAYAEPLPPRSWGRP